MQLMAQRIAHNCQDTHDIAVADAEFVRQMRAGSFLVGAGASTLLVEDAVAAAHVSGH